MTVHPTIDNLQSDLIEFNTHSFVIKIWLEVTPTEMKRSSWRGHITHIPSGERRYVTNLFCMLSFVMRYLKSMGIKFGHFWWIKEWIASRRFPMNDYEGESSLLSTSSQAHQIKPH